MDLLLDRHLGHPRVVGAQVLESRSAGRNPAIGDGRDAVELVGGVVDDLLDQPVHHLGDGLLGQVIGRSKAILPSRTTRMPTPASLTALICSTARALTVTWIDSVSLTKASAATAGPPAPAFLALSTANRAIFR